jgi:hypothetical protein
MLDPEQGMTTIWSLGSCIEQVRFVLKNMQHWKHVQYRRLPELVPPLLLFGARCTCFWSGGLSMMPSRRMAISVTKRTTSTEIESSLSTTQSATSLIPKLIAELSVFLYSELLYRQVTEWSGYNRGVNFILTSNSSRLRTRESFQTQSEPLSRRPTKAHIRAQEGYWYSGTGCRSADDRVPCGSYRRHTFPGRAARSNAHVET